MSTDDIRARVARSRAAQGLPPTITDPAVLDRVADILRGEGLADEPPTKSEARVATRAAANSRHRSHRADSIRPTDAAA